MQDIWTKYRVAIIAAGVVIFAALSTLFVTPETKQAVIIRTGEPEAIVNMYRPDDPFGQTGAGFWWRIPFVDRVQMVERRVLDLVMTNVQVLTSDQQRLLVNAYARYRVIQPVTMIERAGDEDRLNVQLARILRSVLRQELGPRTFASLLPAERGNAMTNIRTKLDAQAREYGAQIIDVRIKRTDLPEGRPLESAYERMRTDRGREAETIRAEGDRAARVIRAEADAEAARIYAASYGKDPAFYDFYRAMQSYDATFGPGEGKGESSIILSRDNE